MQALGLRSAVARRWPGIWRTSLPFRVLATTLLSTLALLGLAAVVLTQMASASIIEAKRESAVGEAIGAQAFMQQQLRSPESRSLASSEALNRLADSSGVQTNQYQMVIEAPTSTLVSTGLEESSVPRALRDRVAAEEGMFLQSTTVRWTSGEPDVPGLAIGTVLTSNLGERVPVYYIFPMHSEQQVLRAIQLAVVLTFGLLVVALGLIVYLVTWQVVSPIRTASRTALAIASGKLDQRMAVRGADEMASLAESMNQMASELQSRIRQLESLSAVQRQFVSDVSHELRTPLTTIRMAADMLHDNREAIDPGSRRTVELMWSEIERFEVLLADLLEISRFDAGAAVLALDDHDLVALVADEIRAHRALAERNGIELRLHALADTAVAELDDRRVRRIIRNLLGNAIDHGQGRPVDVTVAADEDTVALTVRDHGVGFEAEQSAQVFDRFWRADPSRTRVVGGSGLGLSISLEDAKLHRGWLSAWGRPGRGAQFRLTLPRSSEHKVLVSPLPVTPIDDQGGSR